MTITCQTNATADDTEAAARNHPARPTAWLTRPWFLATGSQPRLGPAPAGWYLLVATRRCLYLWAPWLSGWANQLLRGPPAGKAGHTGIYPEFPFCF